MPEPDYFQDVAVDAQLTRLRSLRRFFATNPTAFQWMSAFARRLRERYARGDREASKGAVDAIDVTLRARNFDASLKIAGSTFGRFTDPDTEPQRSNAPLFLGLLALFMLCAAESEESDSKPVALAAMAEHPEFANHIARELVWKLAAATTPAGTGAEEAKSPPAAAPPKELALETDFLKRVFAASARHAFRFPADFLPNAHLPPNVNSSGESYYLVYRYSTIDGQILRTFLVINPPEKTGSTSWSFQHFNWGGEKQPHFFVETEGEVIALDRSYYMIGYFFPVDFNKRQATNITEARAARNKGREDGVRGLEVLACEYASFPSSGDLIPAVTLTFAAEYQPVIARAAFLHLGSVSGLKRILSDIIVQPDEFPSGKLADDLGNMIARVRAVNSEALYLPARLGSCCNEQGVIQPDKVAELARQIVEIIDNTAGYERENAAAPLVNRGALEIFGRYRA